MIHTVVFAAVLFTGASALCTFEGQWHHYEGRCFYISGVDIILDFNTSLARCAVHGAILVSLENKEQLEFVLDKLLSCNDCKLEDPNNQYWIGLRKTIPNTAPEPNITARRLGWTWLGNAWYEWQNWYGEEPNYYEQYARMYGNGQWAGADHNKKFRYVCEREDTIVATSGSTRSQRSTSPTTTLNNTPVTTFKLRPTPSKDNGGTSDPSTSFTTQLGNGEPDENIETNMFLYIGPVLGVVVLIVIGVVIFIVCRRRRAKKKANNMYYNTRDNLNNRPPKDVNLHNDSGNQNTYDTQLPPGHNLSPVPIGPMYAEIDKGGQRNSMQGPPTATKPVDNERISAMYAQPDLTAKKNRRKLNTAPDEDVTLVENSTYATTLPK